MSDIFHVCFTLSTEWAIRLPARSESDAISLAKTLYEHHDTAPFERTDVMEMEWDADKAAGIPQCHNNGLIASVKALLKTSELNADDLEPSTRSTIRQAAAELRMAGAS